jgi:hypothetical protein
MLAQANFTLKLVRPGFGPPAEPAAVPPSVTASRQLQFTTRLYETSFAATAAPLRLRHVGPGRTA